MQQTQKNLVVNNLKKIKALYTKSDQFYHKCVQTNKRVAMHKRNIFSTKLAGI